jgi:hypothetical protein
MINDYQLKDWLFNEIDGYDNAFAERQEKIMYSVREEEKSV